MNDGTKGGEPRGTQQELQQPRKHAAAAVAAAAICHYHELPRPRRPTAHRRWDAHWHHHTTYYVRGNDDADNDNYIHIEYIALNSLHQRCLTMGRALHTDAALEVHAQVQQLQPWRCTIKINKFITFYGKQYSENIRDGVSIDALLYSTILTEKFSRSTR